LDDEARAVLDTVLAALPEGPSRDLFDSLVQGDLGLGAIDLELDDPGFLEALRLGLAACGERLHGVADHFAADDDRDLARRLLLEGVTVQAAAGRRRCHPGGPRCRPDHRHYRLAALGVLVRALARRLGLGTAEEEGPDTDPTED
jgi:hypothetical protein